MRCAAIKISCKQMKASRTILEGTVPLPLEIAKLIPALTNTRHKGMNGKVGVVGGSYEYTGAPYYSAIAATYTVLSCLIPREAMSHTYSALKRRVFL